MLLGLDVAAALVHVQLARNVAVVLQREEELIGVHDRHRAVRLEVARVDGSRLVALDVQHRIVHVRSEEHTSELQSQSNLVCRLLLEKKKNKNSTVELH